MSILASSSQIKAEFSRMEVVFIYQLDNVSFQMVFFFSLWSCLITNFGQLSQLLDSSIQFWRRKRPWIPKYPLWLLDYTVQLFFVPALVDFNKKLGLVAVWFKSLNIIFNILNVII